MSFIHARPPETYQYCLSADLSRAGKDQTVFTVTEAERTWLACEEHDMHNRKCLITFQVRQTHRPTVTSTVEKARQLASMFGELPGDGIVAPILAVDAGGLGGPVVDMLESEYGLKPLSVVTHAGINTTTKRNTLSIPKASLLQELRMVIEQDRIDLAPDMNGRELLLKELHAFGCTVTAGGKLQLEAVTGNDDRVLSLAIGVAAIVHGLPKMTIEQVRAVQKRWGSFMAR